MGIPKYFRYLVSNYDSITIEAPSSDLSIETLCFDLNGQIHPCVQSILAQHPQVGAKHAEQEHTSMYQTNMDMLTEFERLVYDNIVLTVRQMVNLVRPENAVYLAIDGVAPRAKMEQQRLRRYRNVKQKQLEQEVFQKHGMSVPEATFDSNRITPGTIFLYKLGQYLRKVNWNWSLTVWIDDGNRPGEGEHKLIQWVRQHTEWVHCIYGLDADLIMLSLVSSPSIYLVREVVERGETVQGKFIYVDINSLRNVLVQAIQTQVNEGVEETRQFVLDPMATIYDYLVLFFFVGNDFLPALPGIHLATQSVVTLIKMYTSWYKERRIHLVHPETKKINFPGLQELWNRLYASEGPLLAEYMEMVSNRRPFRNQTKSAFDEEWDKLKCYPMYQTQPKLRLGESGWQERYYSHFFQMRMLHRNKTMLKEIAQQYVEGLQWNLAYYLDQCPSWNWYYPYPKAPCLRELCQYMSKRVYPAVFDSTHCWTPLEQLAIVMPIQSATLWPKAYQQLVKTHSQWQWMYPSSVQLDTTYQLFFHDCHPVLPPVQTDWIKNWFQTNSLTKAEQLRNTVSDLVVKEAV